MDESPGEPVVLGNGQECDLVTNDSIFRVLKCAADDMGREAWRDNFEANPAAGRYELHSGRCEEELP
jgi:hypothetical protein